MTVEAIRRGADDFMLKPKEIPHLREIGEELIAKIKHMVTLPALSTTRLPKEFPVTRPAERVVLIGSSAGGPPMLDTLLAGLSSTLPAAVVITQHMPAGFTAPLAARFNRIAQMPVKETENGDILETGKILLSKAGVHTIISTELSAKKIKNRENYPHQFTPGSRGTACGR